MPKNRVRVTLLRKTVLGISLMIVYPTRTSVTRLD